MQGCGCFPRCSEAVDAFEFVDDAGLAQLVEHAAPADCLELGR